MRRILLNLKRKKTNLMLFLRRKSPPNKLLKVNLFQIPWLALVWGSVLNAKYQLVLLPSNRNVNPANQLRAGFVLLLTQMCSTLLIQTPICTLGFLANTFLNAKAVSTSTLLCTCVTTRKLRIPEEIKFLLVTLCVKINLKFLPTFANST